MKTKTCKFQIDSGPWAGQRITLRANFRESALLKIGPSLGHYRADPTNPHRKIFFLTWHPHWTASPEDLYP